MFLCLLPRPTPPALDILPHMKSRVPVFLDYLLLGRRYSVHTVAAYRRDLADFENFLVEVRKTSPRAEEISEDDVRAYLRVLTRRKLSARTVARRLASLRSFQKYLLRRGVRGIQIGPELKGPRIPGRLPGVLSKEELTSLLDGTDWQDYRSGKRDRAILELFYSTGIRLSELIQLRLRDLHLDQGVVQVQGKGNRERRVPVGKTAILTLRMFLDTQDGRPADAPVFPGRSGPLSTRTVQRIVGRHLRRIARRSRLSPHLPHHKSAVKRLRTSEKSKRRNSGVKSLLRRQLKRQRDADSAEAATQLPLTHSQLDRAARKGVIPRGRAARLKSRSAKQAHS